MSAESLSLHARGLLLKIHAITGWKIPEDEAMIFVLQDQFQKLLLEKYFKYNFDEVEYAFRTHGTSIKDWGKSLNLSLIDEAMAPYVSARLEVSKIEEQSAMNNTEKKEEGVTDEQLWNDLSLRVRNDNLTIDFIPVHLYEWKDKEGKITVTRVEKNNYLIRAVERMQSDMAKEVERNNTDANRTALAKFMIMKKDSCFVGQWANRLKNLAKRMIVHDMMKADA